ncbi:Lectin-domain containing receptor kinase A4.2 [Heracleum sosnowskyi]|uniref:Lectin-domain containing receptor kinase A4.2 n=1 Tax=Heracleum sosnowskyi TaxID=360622 RepID=A0AAD8M870_9APIA|nr:Lectin-domain containing receptor kinase A4.2 [Heracleum sosnowskyi]
MLDSSFCVKLGDFGLAKLMDHGKEIKTTVLSGTIGYMAPEYVMTSKASKETEVYSFGIVALEIASGRRPVNPKAKEGEVKLVEFVWSLYGQGKILEAADHKLAMDYDAKQLACLIIVGLWCAHPDNQLRPSIRQAI